MAVNWNYYDKFETLIDKYLPARGEGETKATQIVTAVNKLVYKWYNDGDVFDNTHHLDGWCNDLSDYANWLEQNTNTTRVLCSIAYCYNDSDYEDLLKELADELFNEKYLEEQDKIEKIGTIYECDGRFKFEELHDDEDDYWDDDWYEDEEDEDDE